MRARLLAALLLFLPAAGLLLAGAAEAGRRRGSGPPPVAHEAAGHLTFASPQSNPIAVSPDGSLLAVAATTGARVGFFDTATSGVVGITDVGIDPVGVAWKPDGSELWVSNHVSDSVSVIDTAAGSASRFRVIETVQDLDANGVSQFDEPVGIAFKADGSQAYVALSSRNDVAAVDTTTYTVTGRAHITAQEPRTLAVRGNRLYVLAFESGNRSQLSACETLSDDTHCTLEAADVAQFAVDPNLVNPPQVKDIIVDNDANYPDRDLFVFDVSGAGLSNGESPLDVVSGVGTLLYGMAVDAGGTVYVTQTDARNAVNGSDPDFLLSLQNRIFLNQISEVDCGGAGANPCSTVTRHDLEETPGTPVTLPLATPYGVALDDASGLLIATAAASSRLFSFDPTGPGGPANVLGSLDVGDIPRGIAYNAASGTAYVLNTLANTVSVVSVQTSAGPSFGDLALLGTISLGADPTPEPVRLGRIAFNNADASTSGTFACASCHPDGNTDQLLWRIGGLCVACTGDEPRTTMPIRGLRDSLPLHWDGSLADPYGGESGADPGANDPPSQTAAGDPCSLGDQHACFRHLVEGSLAGVMCDQAGGCAIGPSGQQGLLGDTERADMASFLESVSYPPARSRALDDGVSTQAVNGFQDFFQDDPEGRGQFPSNAVTEPTTCADSGSGCHELPLGTSSNSETLTGFDAPTMRGLTDRFLQFSLGITGTQEMLLGMNDGFPPIGGSPFPTIAQPFGTWSDSMGFEENFTFGVAYALFNLVYGGSAVTIFQMFEEASTGTSGALGRQVTLNSVTTAACGSPCDGSCATEQLLEGLVAADENGLVNLRGTGLQSGAFRTFSYDETNDTFKLGNSSNQLVSNVLTCGDLIDQAKVGTLLATFTARLRGGVSEDVAQPLLASLNAACAAGGSGANDPALPAAGATTVTVAVAHVQTGDAVYLNGQPTGLSVGTVTPGGGAASCSLSDGAITNDAITISGLARGNSEPDLLQIRNAVGLLSNELLLP